MKNIPEGQVMMQRTRSESEKQKKIYDLFINEGMSIEDINEQILEFNQNGLSGLSLWDYILEMYEECIPIILESGEKIQGRVVYPYIGESWESALKRELDELGEYYDPDNILESAIIDDIDGIDMNVPIYD